MKIMAFLIPLVSVLIIVISVGFLVFIFILRPKNKNESFKIEGKDKNTIIKQANKRLAQNPKDAEALLSLAEIYYKDGSYEKAMKTYNILLDMCATNPGLDEFDITLKYAISAQKLKKYEEAYKSLLIARTLNQDSFEVNYNLGYLEYMRKNYERAATLLQQARLINFEHVQTLRYLGHSLFKLKRLKDAVVVLRKTVELDPTDKESLFAMAQCYYEMGQNEQALKIFLHLRADPEIGPIAALYAGTLHLNSRKFEQAIMDFEIGLRHQNVKNETRLEMKYRLAAAYVHQKEVDKALRLYQEIQDTVPAYKDVPELLKKYTELTSNRNLQRYLMSSPSEFATICRKLVEQFFSNAEVKITDISMHKNEYADILAEVNAPKWEDILLFRFFRTSGELGELMLRDLYTRTRELKAGRAFCITAGGFTEEAERFVEARLIDLIDKDGLLKRLNTI